MKLFYLKVFFDFIQLNACQLSTVETLPLNLQPTQSLKPATQYLFLTNHGFKTKTDGSYYIKVKF